MRQAHALESAIRQELARAGTCSIEKLNERLPCYSWNQAFSAVDRLHKRGTIILQHSASFQYLLSLAPNHSIEARRPTSR